MLRVLLVEDDPFVGPALAAVLSFRARVELARSHAEAIARLEGGAFDTILSDVDLGEGPNGLSLLEEVRRRWPSMRRLAMSGSVHVTTETLLLKPIGRDDLGIILEREPALPSSTVAPESDDDIDGRRSDVWATARRRSELPSAMSAPDELMAGNRARRRAN
jgi:CheY-like chemotaxis protein